MDDTKLMAGLADYTARKLHRGQIPEGQIAKMTGEDGHRPEGYRAVIRYWPEAGEIEASSDRSSATARTTITAAMERDRLYDRRAQLRETMVAGSASNTVGRGGTVVPLGQRSIEEGLER